MKFQGVSNHKIPTKVQQNRINSTFLHFLDKSEILKSQVKLDGFKG